MKNLEDASSTRVDRFPEVADADAPRVRQARPAFERTVGDRHLPDHDDDDAHPRRRSARSASRRPSPTSNSKSSRDRTAQANAGRNRRNRRRHERDPRRVDEHGGPWSAPSARQRPAPSETWPWARVDSRRDGNDDARRPARGGVASESSRTRWNSTGHAGQRTGESAHGRNHSADRFDAALLARADGGCALLTEDIRSRPDTSARNRPDRIGGPHDAASRRPRPTEPKKLRFLGSGNLCVVSGRAAVRLRERQLRARLLRRSSLDRETRGLPASLLSLRVLRGRAGSVASFPGRARPLEVELVEFAELNTRPSTSPACDVLLRLRHRSVQRKRPFPSTCRYAVRRGVSRRPRPSKFSPTVWSTS